MSVSPNASEATLLSNIALTCVVLALASVLVWNGVFLVRVVRLRRARRDALAEEELTGYVLDQLAGYQTAPSSAPLPRWKRRILARVLQSLIEQTKGRDQLQLIALLERSGFRDDALARVREGNASERQSACATLAHFDDDESIAAQRAALNDPDFGVRLAAARALLAKDRVPSLRDLLDRLRFDEIDPPLSLAELFARLPPSLRTEAVSLLGADLPAEWLRTLALALARNQIYDAFDPVVALRHHAAPRVRAAAWVALRELGDPRAGDFVLEGLKDAVADVRRAAAECAGKLGGPDVLAPLAALAGENDWWVSHGAAAALWEFGAEGRALLEQAATLGEGARQFAREKRQEVVHG
jgi:hypothetical protein